MGFTKIAGPDEEVVAPEKMEKPSVAGFTVISNEPDQSVIGGEQPQQEEGTFTERFKQRQETRYGEVMDTVSQTLGGDINPYSASLQLVGKGVAGPMLDFVGEGMTSIGKGILAVVPDEWEESVKESAKAGMKIVADTEVGQQMGEMLEKGVDAFSKWWTNLQETNPTTAKNIESAVNIGLILAPAKGNPKAKPTAVDKASAALRNVAGKQERATKRTFLNELVRPVDKASEIDQINRTVEVGRGPFKRGIINPSTKEASQVDELMKIQGLGSGQTAQGNFNLTRKHIDNRIRAFESKLASENVDVPVALSHKAIDEALDSISSNATLTGDAKRIALDVAEQARIFLNKNEKTPLGILKARRELDRWVSSQKGDKIFDPVRETATTLATREVRTSLNDLLDRSALSVSAKKELSAQANILNAMDVMQYKAWKESNWAIGRLWQDTLKITRVKNEVVQSIAVAIGMGGLGAAANIAPFFSGGLAAAAIFTTGKKMAMSPQTKKGLAQLLQLSERAIRSSKDPSMIKQLRADRAIVVELMKNAQVIQQRESEGE